MNIKLSGLGMMIEVGTNVLMVEEFIQVLKHFTDHFDCMPIFLFDISDLTFAMGGIPKNHPLENEGIEVQDPTLKRMGYKKISLYDETASAVSDSVKHVLSKAGKQNVKCGIHYKTLESINDANKDFSVSLINNIDFLVEDSLIF
jgi:phosphoenolpyruvate synthase/pyruvate phosphate dikinase